MVYAIKLDSGSKLLNKYENKISICRYLMLGPSEFFMQIKKKVEKKPSVI